MEFSIIKKYTNAKGFSHDAHFNANGKYIGSVKKHDKDQIQLKPKMKQVEQMEQADEVQYSIIKKYTNANGFSHDAHFNANGKYIGSVKKHGKEPIQLKPKMKQQVDNVEAVEVVEAVEAVEVVEAVESVEAV